MQPEEIKNILDNLFNQDIYNKILINGEWGIGKSYNVLEYYNSQKLKNNKNEEIIYLTVFGKHSIDVINQDIILKLFNAMSPSKKGVTFSKELLKILPNLASGLSICKGNIGLSLDFIDMFLSKKSFIENNKKTLENGKKILIIIDDIERISPNIKLEEFLGVVQEICDISKFKVCLICSENNMSDENKKIWTKFKEKVIEREYEIDSVSTNTLTKIFVDNLKKIIEENKVEKFCSNYFANLNSLGVQNNNIRNYLKGLKLFKEIYCNVIENMEIDEELLEIILEICLDLEIEINTPHFLPNEEDKNSKDFAKQMQYLRDSDTVTRISANYLKDYYEAGNGKFVSFIYRFGIGNYDKKNVEKFKNTVENYSKEDKLKNYDNAIFLQDTDDVKNRINERINQMIQGKYKFIDRKEFFKDFNEIFIYSDYLKMKLGNKELYPTFERIMFDNDFDDTNKKLEECKINIEEYFIESIKEQFSEIIKKYNKNVTLKYMDSYIEKIKNTMKKANITNEDIRIIYDMEKLFLYDFYKDEIFKKFENENFFLFDMSGKVKYMQYIWNMEMLESYKKMLSFGNLSEKEMEDQNKKIKIINEYLNELGKKDEMAKYRVELLLK